MFQDCNYVATHGSEATPADIAAVVALEREAFDERYRVSPERDRDLFNVNRENGLIVKERPTDEVVGYVMILPVREDIRERIRTGRFVDASLTREMVLTFDRPGDYHLYFASIARHPQNDDASLLPMMLDLVAKDFVSLAERGIFGKTLTADVVSNEGVELARRFGLSEICRSDHGSRIFELTAPPLPRLCAASPAVRRLVELYQAHFLSS